MKNAALVSNFEKRKAKRTELAVAKKAAERSYARIAKLEGEVRDLERITKVVDGVALSRRDGWLQAVGDDIRRCAHLYPNARNDGKTYGLYTYTDMFGKAGEKWHGYDLSKAEAEAKAIAWVVKGVR